MASVVKITSIEKLTHDVLRIAAEKPAGLNFHPGQAVDISINKQEWNEQLRAFTFTSLPTEDKIEFIIKTYPSHKGVTLQLLSLKKDDELIIQEPFGDITYKGEGIFIAGGAGITPFVAILKQLEKENKVGNNKLIFANKTKADILLEEKFKALLGSNFTNVLSEEKLAGYEHGFISGELINKHIENPTGYFYLCGPEPMMAAVSEHLAALGIEEAYIVKEAF